MPATVDGVLDRLRSTSFVAALDEEPREELVARAAELLAGYPDLVGAFDYPHHTVLYSCRSE